MNWSVVIPTCNRPHLLARCLRALPKDHEIIVSDDSEGDESRQLIEKEFSRVRWLRGPRRGPAANRNRGAAAATGDWLAFTDDDCEPQPGWLEEFDRAADGADVLEGRTEAPGAQDSPFEEHVENVRGGLLWSCNLAVRRSVFTELGGFDEDFPEAAGEDMEFAWRLSHTNLPIRFVPEALVHHPPRRIGLAGLWRRTLMIRWIALYRAKTGQLRSLPRTAINECADLLRITVHLATKPEFPYRRRQIFHVGRRWVTFPMILPYLLYWTERFRRQVTSPLR